MLLFTDDHLFWYVARAAGLGAYLVLFIDVILGLMVRTKVGDRLVARWQSFDLHQFTSFVAIGLLALHVVALLGDHYIGYTVPQVLIPFTSPYRPVETAFGVIGMYLIVVTTVSFWLKRFIGQRGWRTLHYATFSAFFLSLLHGLTAGTDSN
jgi:predicted ferric reductase